MDQFANTLPSFYLLAIAFGAAGQFLRGSLGLAKRFRELGEFAFKPRLFGLTLIIGGIAGLLGALIYDLQGASPMELSTDRVLGDRNFILMAISAGYFGTDVIEGILGRFRPGTNRRAGA